MVRDGANAPPHHEEAVVPRSGALNTTSGSTRKHADGGDIFRISEIQLDNFGFSDYCSPVPFLPKGRLAIVTDAERDAVDADAPLANGAEADGEIVWS